MIPQQLLIFLLTAVVGFLSSLLGVGGGVLLVPIFTLILKLPIHEAIALSLSCVMATSITSSSKYLASGLIDLKAVLYLETVTVVASYLAGKAAGLISDQAIALAFSTMLIVSAVLMILSKTEAKSIGHFSFRGYPPALGASVLAGGLVGFLGVGGGIIKVPIVQLLLGKPVKEAVACSGMMIGISAAIGIIPYMSRGELPLNWIAFAALGTILGSYLGSKIFHKIESSVIKFMFAVLLIYTAVTMAIKTMGK